MKAGFTRAMLGTLILVAGWGSSASAQGVGAIGGSVVDTSGAVLPGVTVSLVTPGVIGGTQTTVSDERGAFLFPRLVPTRYNVRAELAGFRPMVQENVVVNADATARVDLRLELGNVAESITVSGQAPLLDTTNAINQTVMGREVLDVLPGTNDMWSVARLVPSVTQSTIDVGGSNSFIQGRATVHGSLPSGGEANYQIDGLNTDVVAGASGSISMYYDPFMFEEINYQTSNGSAENARGGIVFNMVTKTGTNRLTGAFVANGSNRHFQSNNITPDLRTQLLAAVPPSVLAANPNLSPSAQNLHIFDVGASFSGPIVRDKLWWSASFKTSGLDQLRLGSYNPDGSQFVDDNLMWTGSVKGSWAINSNNQLHVTHINHLKRVYHYLGGQTGFFESAASQDQHLPVHLDSVRWTSARSSRLLLDVSGNFTKTGLYLYPQAEVGPGTIPGLDLLTNTRMTAAPTYSNTDYYRGVIQSSLSYVAGTHNLKVGYQWDLGWQDADTYSTSHEPAGLQAVYTNGVPNSVRPYNTPTSILQRIREQGVYVRDTWTPHRKLTINAGVRLDRTTSWQPAACQPETIFIAGSCFDAINDVPDWLDISPRLALVYDVFGDGRTAIKFGANRYMVGIGASTVNTVNPIRVTFDTRSWSDPNRDGIPQLNELGASTGFNLGTTNRYAEGFERPYAAEYSVEFERQLFKDSVVSAAYFYRGRRRQIGSTNLAVPPEGYIPLQVTEVTSGRQVTVYNLNPALRGRFDVLWDNSSALDSAFHGVDLTVNKRLDQRWMMMAGLSLGRSTGDIFNTADLNNPNFQFRREGVLDNDIPVALKVSGSYQAPYGVMASAAFQHYAGRPELTTVVVAASTVPLTQVNQSIVVEPQGTTRLPDVNMLDISLRRVFKPGSGLSVEPVIEVFNLLNGNATQSRTTVLGPAYGRVAGILAGRMVKFAINAKF